MPKLNKIIVKSGTITTVGRLHIGAGGEGGIGGIDSAVVKNQITGEPFIPGTSLKGKMRYGLETSMGRADVCNCKSKECIICTLFGCMANSKSPQACGKTRIIVKDCNLAEEFTNNPNVLVQVSATAIDRASGVAKTGALRTIEAVEKGVKFNFEVNIRVYEGDNEKLLSDTVDECLERIRTEGLGAKTSSGLGQVDIEQNDDVELDY